MAEQISISRETLRAELGEVKLSFTEALAALELRLLDRLADKATVSALEARLKALEERALIKGGPLVDDVHKLDKRLLSLEEKAPDPRIDGLEAWRNRLGGAAAAALFLASAAALRVFFGIG